MFDLAAAEVEKLERSNPKLAAQLDVVRPSDTSSSSSAGKTGKETLASLRVPSAHGAIIQKKAASLWPYKLVAAVLEKLLAEFPVPSFNLQTNTPVTSLARHPSGAGWVLTTPRGTITARQVLLATNGYTSHMLPAFSDLIVPVRGQIGALIPPASSASSSSSSSSSPPPLPAKLTHSYVFAADPDPAITTQHHAGPSGDAAPPPPAPRDDYLVQRPLPAGELIYGGGRRFAQGLGVGQWADDELEEPVAAYLRESLAPVLDLTPTESHSSLTSSSSPPSFAGEGGGKLEASFEWTGVMGYSRDAHAWVGPVPESLGGGDGLWICAGYTGHGMPAAALSAREVVRQMTGGGGGGDDDGDDVGEAGVARLPEEFRVSEERVQRARGMVELTGGWEATNFAALVSGAGPTQ